MGPLYDSIDQHVYTCCHRHNQLHASPHVQHNMLHLAKLSELFCTPRICAGVTRPATMAVATVCAPPSPSLPLSY